MTERRLAPLAWRAAPFLGKASAGRHTARQQLLLAWQHRRRSPKNQIAPKFHQNGKIG
jgi:hypothetical protein